MKKLYTLFTCAFLLFLGGKGFSQASFQLYVDDSIAYGDTMMFGDIECYGGEIRNKTSNAILLDVVRVQNVNLATGWESYFCTNDQCYADFVDSVRFTLPGDSITEFLPHFGTTATPDSQTVYFKIKNVNTPTDVAYQRYHGVTKIGYGSGLNEYAHLANVNIYPSPVKSGNTFNLNITNSKVQGDDFTLSLYSIYGSVVRIVTGLHGGNNSLNLDIPSGIYSYRLTSGSTMINSGNLAVLK